MKQKSISFSLEYKFPTLNDWYSGNHWKIRSVIKKKSHSYISSLLNDIPEKPEIITFTISLRYNLPRRDADNMLPVVKLFVDCLKNNNWILEDSPKYFKSFEIIFDEKLNKNSQIITINY